MDVSVDDLITALKGRFGAKNDADLARKLRIDKSTISSWRSRKSVPERFVRILEGESTGFVQTPPGKWGQHEAVAFDLAMFRYSRAVSSVALSGDYRRCLEVFTHAGLFWGLMEAAQSDLAGRQAGGNYDMATAFALLVHDDLDAGDDSIQRDRNVLLKMINGLFHPTIFDTD